ncbi:PH domain-containing protein [Microbacterium caowuchunii]|uniref:PH domain-containing protein n=1 Tax=Microbacterium caowuchunii TaxID=2614638 RepID=UPI0012446303|nr:PH domain-containing protein [Microbacterium caowuchunii]QEV99625.1 PH domain-containing protein [Microbacterium caowuchunii]
MIISAVVAASLLGDAFVRAGIGSTLLLAPWVLLLLWAVYVLLFASAVTTDVSGITVQNFLRRTRVPWGAVDDIVLRYQLIVTTKDGSRVTCFGGPVSGRSRRLPGRDDGNRMPNALRDLDLIRADWERALDGDAAAGPVARSWDLPALLALLVLVLGAVVATVIVSGSGSA